MTSPTYSVKSGSLTRASLLMTDLLPVRVDVATTTQQHQVVRVKPQLGMVGPPSDVVDVEVVGRSADLAHAGGTVANKSAQASPLRARVDALPLG